MVNKNLNSLEQDLLKFMYRLIKTIPDNRQEQDRVLAEHYRGAEVSDYKASIASLVEKGFLIASISQVYPKEALEPAGAHHSNNAIPYSLSQSANEYIKSL